MSSSNSSSPYKRRPRARLPRALFSLAIAVFAVSAGSLPPVATSASCATGDSLCSEISNAQARAGDNRQALADIENKISDTQTKMHALASLIASLDRSISEKQAEISSTQAKLVALDASIKRTQADLARRQAELQQREALFGDRVREMDKRGSVNYVELVVTASSFNDMLDRIVIMQQLIDADHRMLEELRSERAAVQKLAEQLQSQRADEASLLGLQQRDEQDLVASRQQQQAAWAYEAQLDQQYESQRRVLEAQQAAIAGQIGYLRARYAAELAAIAARQSQSGAGGSSGGGAPGFMWPQAAHLITQGFGCTDLLGEPYWPSCPTRHFHTGIDIAGPDGTPIYASAAGVVTDNPGGIGYGNYVLMLHANGFATLYGHLSAFAVPSGTVVSRGQVIGYEGSTGFSTGPHLHFEIRYNGAWQDPCTYVGC